jgi:secreted trypsin-like serine protease
MSQLHSYPYRNLLLLLCLSLSAHLTCSSTALRKKMNARMPQEPQAQQETNGLDNNDSYNRIINGEFAREGRFDYFVRLIGSNRLGSCGGALVAPDIVITAAHCEAEVLLELVEIGNRQEGNPVRAIEDTIVHPFYLGIIPDYDIMVVKLADPGKSLKAKFWKRQPMCRFQ